MYKKIVLTVLTSMFLLSALFETVSDGLVITSPTVIRVPDDYQTIQEAINAANLGDNVQVATGTYYEHVTVNKSLALIGDKGATILDGNGTGSVIRISANDVNITGFTIQNGVYGIYLNYSSDNTIHGNNIANNNNGISLWHTYGNTVKGNDVQSNVAGISLYYSDNNTVNNNNVANNSWHGIASWDYSDNNMIVDNTITNNTGNGILVYYSCNNNTISSNNVSKNVNNGIYLYNSSNSTIENNNISKNNRGILIRDSPNNTINNNIVSNHARYAIYVDFSSSNTIEGNNMINNTYGMQLYNSSGNTVYHNNIISNGKQVEQQRSSNAWDNGVEGNYWSDHTGVDANGDGIGDTPYIIDEDDKDQYPLMSPWIPLPIIFIVSPSNDSEIRTSVLTITWMGIDKGSGIDHYEIRLDGGSWITVGIDTAYTLSAVNDGGHKIEVKVVDKTGRSQVASVNLIVNTSPLGGPGYIEEATVFAAIVVAALAITVYLFKIRKKHSSPEDRRPNLLSSENIPPKEAMLKAKASVNVGYVKRLERKASPNRTSKKSRKAGTKAINLSQKLYSTNWR